MNEKLFQIIFDKLQEVVPVKWHKIIFYAAYTNGSYGMKYYVDMGNGQFTDCFSIEGISDMRLMKLFVSLDKDIAVYREQLEDLKKWNVLTMMIESTGTFKTDFDYSDISENFISYEKDWAKRYL